MLFLELSDYVDIIFGGLRLDNVFLSSSPASQAHEKVKFRVITLARFGDDGDKSRANGVIMHPVATGVVSCGVAVPQTWTRLYVWLLCEPTHLLLIVPLLSF